MTHLLIIDPLRLIYDLLPPIYRVQFARVSRLWYNAASIDMRDMNAIIRARVPHKCVIDMLDHGAYIAGEFLLDCLHDTTHSNVIDVVFDIGADYRSGFNTLAPPPYTDKKNQFNAYFAKLQNTSCGGEGFVYTCSSGMYPDFTIRALYIDGIHIDVGTTDPGVHNITNMCTLPFNKIVYDGKNLTVLHPMSIIKKHLDICGGLLHEYMSVVDSFGRAMSTTERDPRLIIEVIKICRSRGFTITVSPDSPYYTA